MKANFETWSDDKFNKYDIDLDTYDHTDINSRPPILMDLYVKNKKYLTCIFLWDSKLDFLISAKYDPLKLGRGEAGLRRKGSENSISGISTCTSSSRTASPSKNNGGDFSTMVKSICDAVYQSKPSSIKKRKKKGSGKTNQDLRMQSLSDLMELIKQHQQYMKFLEECGNLKDEKKNEIISEIEEIFTIIRERKGCEDTNVNDSDSNTTSVSSD